MATAEEIERIDEKPATAKHRTAEEEAFIERFANKKRELEVDRIFRALVKLEGSDLHMKVGRPPMIRTRNELKPLNRPPVSDEEMTSLLMPLMSERHRKIFEEEGGADFSHTCEVDGVTWRFRGRRYSSIPGAGPGCGVPVPRLPR